MTFSEAIKFVQTCDIDDLDVLSREIKRRKTITVSRLAPGAAVVWRDKNGVEYDAVVQKVNQKTVSLSGGNHPRYRRGVRVPKEWVRPA